MSEQIIPPVGLTGAVSFVCRMAEQARYYRFCGMQPPHCILNLDPGEGRTTFTRFLTDMLMSHDVRRFDSLESWLEYELSGDSFQMQSAFYDIQSNSAYANNFSGVIALSLLPGFASAMEDPQSGTPQTEVFLGKLKEAGKYATLVIFVPAEIDSAMQELVERIGETLGRENVEVFSTRPYTTSELAEILRRQLEQSQVVLEGSPCLQALLLDAAVSGARVRTVKEVGKLCRSLIRQADFREEIPRLNCAELLPALQQTYLEKTHTDNQEVS